MKQIDKILDKIISAGVDVAANKVIDKIVSDADKK